MSEKKTCIEVKNAWPVITRFIVRSVRRWFSAWKRRISWFWRPKSLASITPEIDRVSCVIAVTSAADFWVSALTARRLAPTVFERAANMGTIAIETSASCQDRMNMAMRVLMKMTLLDSTFETVLVTTFWTPPTSLATRDWISPVRVSVKKLNDRLCRCSYSLSLRSRMTRCPTRFVRKVCTMPRPPVTTVMRAITPAMTHSSPRSGPASRKRAESNTTRISSGLTTPSPAVNRIRRPTIATVPR